MNEYNPKWNLVEEGIYQTKFPKEMTLSFLINDMTSVIQDYTKNMSKDEISIKAMIDTGDVESCPKSVLNAWNHAVLEYPKAKTAVYNESKVFKEVSDSYYSKNKMADTMKRFNTAEEALAWLKE